MRYPREEPDDDDDERVRNKKAATDLARRAAANGDPLAGMLSELERMGEAAGFFLGTDYDFDEDDE